ncbi:hypothetical protein GW17_00014964 [Ensete ventricosum]|nr:hypothetical protein GW17_00014964 [Ensete ventricosum]RZR89583.1 hypothetical protein BHM03_00017341 [Ensete ventricosum]
METHRAALLFLLFLPTFFHAGNAMAAGVRQAKWRRELPTYSGSGLYETRYFTQTLDHFNFNPQSYAKFQQRYLVNDTHWGGKGSPIFVYTGNEGGIELFAKNTGFMFEIAPSFKALLVFIEHRYYGESIPFGGEDVAYSNASTLGYLSSTQAIADFATLIIDLKKNLTSEDSPVVAFGGSYGGSKNFLTPLPAYPVKQVIQIYSKTFPLSFNLAPLIPTVADVQGHRQSHIW